MVIGDITPFSVGKNDSRNGEEDKKDDGQNFPSIFSNFGGLDE